MSNPGLFGGYNPTGTYNFFPSNAEIIAGAYGRIQIRRTELEPTHIQDAVLELNLFLSQFNDAGPNLAQVDQQSLPLIAGQAVYTLPAETVMVTDMWLSTIPAATITNDSYMFPISRTEYAAIPNKMTPGRPNQYWLNRQQTPQVTLYPVPDSAQSYTLKYFRFRQVQDSQVGFSMTPEVANRAIDALVAGLAYRLSKHYRPEQEDKRKADAAEAWGVYAKQDTENVPLYIQPALSPYWRQ